MLGLEGVHALFDDRSANTDRLSGWERYTRSLLGALGPRVQPLGQRTNSVVGRLVSDWVTIPRAIPKGEVVHFPTFPPTALGKGRIIWTLHDLTWWLFPETASTMGRHYYRPLAARAVKRVDAILTVSHAVRDDVVECLEIAPEKVFVTPLGVPQLPPAAPEVRQKPYLLSVGTLEPRKNMARLAEAFTRSHLSSAFDLVICGRVGWGATVPGVTVIDGASDDRLAALYRGATAMILPSLYEGFGLPLVEALSLGVPVYCSDTPVFREVAGNHAHFFDPWDIDSITDAVIKAAKEAAPAPGGAAHASRFTWEACAHATLAAYDAVRAS